MYPRALCALPMLAALACSDTPEPEAVPWTQRDSAGIRIVENRWEPEGLLAGWSVGGEPELTLGRLEGPEELQLYSVQGATLLPDGRIAVVDGGSKEVRLFGRDGSFLARHGGEGDGPGEFLSPSLVGRRADTLVVFDGDQRRVTLIHPDEGFLRSYPVSNEGGGFPIQQGMFADGTINFGGGVFFSSSEGFPSGRVRPASPFVAVSSEGAEVASYGEFPGPEMFARATDGGFSAVGLPYGRWTAAATGDSLFWIGTLDAWEVRGYTSRGALHHIARMDVPARPVTPELREAWLDDRVADAADEDERQATLQRYRDVPSGDAVPPHGSIRVDALDHLWISDYRLPGDDTGTVGWTVLDPGGRAVGRIELPTGDPLEIGEDWILLHRRDELDVERLELLRLERPR